MTTDSPGELVSSSLMHWLKIQCNNSNTHTEKWTDRYIGRGFHLGRKDSSYIHHSALVLWRANFSSYETDKVTTTNAITLRCFLYCVFSHFQHVHSEGRPLEFISFLLICVHRITTLILNRSQIYPQFCPASTHQNIFLHLQNSTTLWAGHSYTW